MLGQLTCVLGMFNLTKVAKHYRHVGHTQTTINSVLMPDCCLHLSPSNPKATKPKATPIKPAPTHPQTPNFSPNKA